MESKVGGHMKGNNSILFFWSLLTTFFQQQGLSSGMQRGAEKRDMLESNVIQQSDYMMVKEIHVRREKNAKLHATCTSS